MTAPELRQTLTRDLEGRYREIDQVRGTIPITLSVGDQETRRRPLILLLYAHLEGFCVFALREYVRAITLKKLKCVDVKPDILAGAWSTLFADLNSEEKCDLFGRKLTDDSTLHKHWRRRQFIANIEHFLSQPVSISTGAIRSDSNLTSTVLKRNLFVVGISYDFVSPFEKTINALLGRRNAVAHGQDMGGITATDYSEYETCFREITGRLLDYLVEALETEQYRSPVIPVAYVG